MSKKPIINVHEEVYALCVKLGLEPELVAELTIQPGDVRAVVYLTNEAGNKYVDQSGQPATDIILLEVTT